MSSADGARVRRFLARASRRRNAIRIGEGAAAGLLAATLCIMLTGWPVPRHDPRAWFVLAATSIVGGVLAAMAIRRGESLTRRIERGTPESHNVIATAAELLDQERRADRHAGANAGPYLTGLVLREAARVADAILLPRLFPARRLIVLAGLALGMLLLNAWRPALPAVAAALGVTTAPSIDGIEVVVTPPAYTGWPVARYRSPARVTALAGSTVALRIDTRSALVHLETLDRNDTLRSRRDGAFRREFVVEGDGYVALEPVDAEGRRGTRQLIGITPQPDAAPRVAITRPGRDQHLLDGTETLQIAITAEDDLALATLALRFVRVSGSGERFSFTEGEVPVRITRTDAGHWQATAAWPLQPLALEPGDMVVYRAVVTDRRPGAPAVESDAFIADVLAPGSMAGGGFDTDPEVERYALSQQMIILKTERLIAARARMPVDSFREQSFALAMEQRSVRAEFVFMMGGELEAAPVDLNDLGEEAHAESEGEMLAGHEKNTGRLALTTATRAMSRSSTLLNEVDPVAALPFAKRALVELEKAFAHSRILLRALNEQERLDLTRRLTGPVTDAARSHRPSPEPARDPGEEAEREILSGIAALAAARPDEAAGARASALAEALLRTDPSATDLQRIAGDLGRAASALGRGDRDGARALLEGAVHELARRIRTGLLRAPVRSVSGEGRELDGSLADALRRAGLP